MTAAIPSPPLLRYVGDLSRADAVCLAALAGRHRRVLEFGVGASTQIFAQAAGTGVTIVSLDRAAMWIERTRALVDVLAPEAESGLCSSSGSRCWMGSRTARST